MAGFTASQAGRAAVRMIAASRIDEEERKGEERREEDEKDARNKEEKEQQQHSTRSPPPLVLCPAPTRQILLESSSGSFAFLLSTKVSKEDAAKRRQNRERVVLQEAAEKARKARWISNRHARRKMEQLRYSGDREKGLGVRLGQGIEKWYGIDTPIVEAVTASMPVVALPRSPRLAGDNIDYLRRPNYFWLVPTDVRKALAPHSVVITGTTSWLHHHPSFFELLIIDD